MIDLAFYPLGVADICTHPTASIHEGVCRRANVDTKIEEISKKKGKKGRKRESWDTGGSPASRLGTALGGRIDAAPRHQGRWISHAKQRVQKEKSGSNCANALPCRVLSASRMAVFVRDSSFLCHFHKKSV
ncbi:MAG: hypothetical protein JSW66_15160 [Phycisphaerales bacterium]|nr:MAG: hypothetical protein JSW66_15160 [Phycisphaerales bacterium]